MAFEKDASEPKEQTPTSLSKADQELIFREATKGLVHRCGVRFSEGLSDDDLRAALKDCLGIFGGSGGPGRPSVSYCGSGLKIWGGWHVVNHVTSKPLFAGEGTVAMAREVYGISDPDKDQLSLL